MNGKITNTELNTTYNKPSDILAADDISQDEKIRLLKDWEYTLRQVQVAEEENMLSGPHADLTDVLAALNELNAKMVDTGISKT